MRAAAEADRLSNELSSAAASGLTERAELLLKAGAEVNRANRFGRNPVQVMMMGSEHMARLLLSHGANPNVVDVSTGATPLHDAAREGFLTTVELLVRAGADITALDYRGWSPAQHALQAGHAHIAKYLHSL
ncbi:cyclin-dependent kinase 4 inhibitor B [Tachysurus fulvidraco]|uniref:cyclin-dependent kinase 4 inhibitor B n=1 Tax=Tachysurus fulvidraco TaxID=1234273 RepID=UPI000F4DF0E7|nr:cyclin-dependent kinase 4 inhibitor B [Tachysurus fulvidraco]XP_047667914.1 cyclin-dependent kinase 4 inhibitor B [Tachysurus fulvidraco]